jgi:DNA-binding transcriptional MerR regulator
MPLASGCGVAVASRPVSQLEQVTLYAPGQVARRLGVSTAMLRRYADALEAVTGHELVREKKARVFTERQVEQLAEARDICAATSVSVEEALRRVLGLAEVPAEAGAALATVATAQALQAWLEGAAEREGRYLATITQLQETIARLEGKVDALSNALPVVSQPQPGEVATVQPIEDERVTRWQDYMTETSPPARRPAPKVPRPSWLARLFRR